MNPNTIDNEERKLWVQNDEGLYDTWLMSGLSLDLFVYQERGFIDCEIKAQLKNGAVSVDWIQEDEDEDDDADLSDF